MQTDSTPAQIRHVRSASLAAVIVLFAFSAQQPAAGELLEGIRYSQPKQKAAALGNAKRLVFELPRAVQSPAIDGELSDPCWKTAQARLGTFRLGLTAVPARHAREAWAAYDDRFLYLAVRLEREPGTELRVFTHEPDNGKLWEDDEIEIFLDPFNTGSEYLQLIMNSACTVFDASHRNVVVLDPKGVGPNDTKLDRQSDIGWDANLVRKVAIHDRYWSAEMAVPLESIGLRGAPAGHRVGFNITSADWDTNEYTCLSPTTNWHDPKQFGVFVLGKPEVAVTELDLGGVGAGRNRLQMHVRDLADRGGAYNAILRLTAGGVESEASQSFSLARNGSSAIAIDVETRATDGAWEAVIEIRDGAGSSVFAARRVGTLPKPLILSLKPRATFTDARPVLVAARLGVGSVSTKSLSLTVRLRDGNGRVVAGQNLGTPTAPNLNAWLPVDGLAPGLYRVQLVATADGRTIADAEDVLRICGSPFTRER